MPHFPKPFYRKPRRRWYVQLGGKQVNLGPDRDTAFQKYHDLLAAPETADIVRQLESFEAVAILCDRFLGWVQSNRAAATYEGYQYRLLRFVDRYPEISVEVLRPFHVQEWADSYDFSVTSRRNDMSSVKTCLRWALHRRQSHRASGYSGCRSKGCLRSAGRIRADADVCWR